ncbi:hypothetical protein EX895_003626 [Sporisorium graminicola]|uniref:VOC domain-containing protein n=1 Tax=Sporisorium graminicola TaxID=280036 RepID=A0A4V6ETK1_9BASI|nr:hypothetical protein EX895_003626 [Sporisorium graminicola]TKY86949.1 hypothetical protein EX895_003626 [Sporisorium graminicola]
MENRVILRRIAHIHYRHKDLGKSSQFLRDFGFEPVQHETSKGDKLQYYRGYGDLPYIYVAEEAAAGAQPEFVRVAFEADSEEDFKNASKVAGASEVRQLVEAPGGGQLVSLFDPNGTQIDVIYGQQLVEARTPQHVTQPINPGVKDNEQKPRRAGTFQRFDPTQTIQVHKLGHFVLQIPNYDE